MKAKPKAIGARQALGVLGLATTLACACGNSLAGEGSAQITAFTWSVSAGTLSWLDPYTSFSATALTAGGLLGAQSDSYATGDYLPLAVGAGTTGAAAGVSTQDAQLFWADALTSSTPAPAGSQRNQAQALGTQSGSFLLSQAGVVTLTVSYVLAVAAPGGNALDNFSTALLHLNAATDSGSTAFDRSDVMNSFEQAAGTASRSGQFSVQVALAAGETGYYTLDGGALSFSPTSAVPEPGAGLQLCGGLLVMAALLRRRLDPSQRA